MKRRATFTGKPCAKCGSTERFVSEAERVPGGRCYPCRVKYEREYSRNLAQDPEYRARRCERECVRWRLDPEVRKRHRERCRSPEYRERRRKRDQFTREATREALLARFMARPGAEELINTWHEGVDA